MKTTQLQNITTCVENSGEGSTKLVRPCRRFTGLHMLKSTALEHRGQYT